MSLVEWLANGNALYLGEQFTITLGIAFGALAVLTSCCLGMAISIGRSRSASSLFASTSAAISSMPIVVVALILEFLAPSDALPYLLPIFLGFTPLIISSLSGAATARNVATRIVLGHTPSVYREIRLIYLPFCALGAARGVSVALPSVLLGTLIGQMMNGEGLGQRLSAASISVSSQQRLEVLVPLIALAIALRGFVWWGERALARRLGVAQVEGRTMQIIPTGIGKLAMTIAIPGVAFAVLWCLVALAMPKDVHIVRLPQMVPGDLAAEVAGSVLRTLGRVVAAFAASIVAGYLICVLTPRWKGAQQVFYALAVVVQTVPAMFFLPLLAALSANYALNAIVVGTIAGTYCIVELLSRRRTDWIEIEAHRLQARLAGWHRLERYVMLPWSVDALLAGCKIAMPQIVSAILVCEYFSVGDGLGDSLKMAYLNVKYDRFWTLVLALLAGIWAVLGLITIVEYFLSKNLRTTS